jgi:hypothetical protein
LRESLKTPSQFKPVGTHNTILHHCRPNQTGNGSGKVENKVVDLWC